MMVFDPKTSYGICSANITSYGICSANIGSHGSFSKYVTRQYDDLISAVEGTMADESWSIKDPLLFAEISHPKATAVSILDTN